MSVGIQDNGSVRARKPWEYHLLHHSEEIARLTLLHETLRDGMNCLAMAPVQWSRDHLKIMDAGTADGRWLRDLHDWIQDLQPSTNSTNTFIGVDSNEQYFPTRSDLPANLFLVRQRVDDPWPQGQTDGHFSPNFDYIHQRFVLPACEKIPMRDAVHNMAALLAPGGWIELLENDHDTDPAVSGGFGPGEDFFRRLFKASGVDPAHPKYMKGWLEEAGLQDIHETIVSIPIGRLNKTPELAAKSTWSIVSALKGLLPLARALPMGLTREEIDGLPEVTRERLEKEGGVLRLYCVYGRKPQSRD